MKAGTEKIVVSIRVNPDSLQEIRELAQAEERTVSNMFSFLANRGLKAHKKALHEKSCES